MEQKRNVSDPFKGKTPAFLQDHIRVDSGGYPPGLRIGRYSNEIKQFMDLEIEAGYQSTEWIHFHDFSSAKNAVSFRAKLYDARLQAGQVEWIIHTRVIEEKDKTFTLWARKTMTKTAPAPAGKRRPESKNGNEAVEDYPKDEAHQTAIRTIIGH